MKGMIQPCCAESAVKHQPANQRLLWSRCIWSTGLGISGCCYSYHYSSQFTRCQHHSVCGRHWPWVSRPHLL